MVARGIALGVALLALLAGGCKPGEAAPEDAALSRGRAHVEKKCVGCHAGAKLDAAVAKRNDPAALDGFLSGHYLEDAALRSDVVAYLLSRQLR